MKDIKKDLEKDGWGVELKVMDHYKSVLFLIFSDILDTATKRQIIRIVADRAQVKSISVGSFHAIIISK